MVSPQVGAIHIKRCFVSFIEDNLSTWKLPCKGQGAEASFKINLKMLGCFKGEFCFILKIPDRLQ